MKSGKINFRNLSLAVYSNANERKTPVLFVHGNSMSAKVWDKQFSSSLSEKYHLVAFDMPGCGASDHSNHPEKDYNLSDIGDAMVEVINHYGLKDYIVVGYSLGGNVVMQNVSKLKNCKGLFINSVPVTLPLMLDKMYLPNPDLAIMFQKEYTEDALDRILKNYFVDPSLMPSFLKAEFKQTDGLLRQTVMNNIVEGKLIDEILALDQAKIPVAFVTGEKERVMDNNYFDTFSVATTWKGSVQFIPMANHCPQWERPEEYNALLDNFIADCN
jgi:pimeloyl-ACP methyl ester carboxylesterase